ncbi:MAG: crosslink repair DNA glycosylase YcaQ family protein [Candidatus Zixiibacteriota bacterium]
MKASKISIERARHMAVNSQLLDGWDKIPKTKNGVLKIIDTLGYVQIDTISVIERAHHHTLWSRMPEYRQGFLYTLLEKDRKIFEYFGHALSYLPMKDFRYYHYRKKILNDPVGKWEKDRMDKYGHLMKPVLERIKNEGPLGSRDFESSAKGQGNDWTGHPKPNKAALDLLFWTGEIMIFQRENNHRLFDLTERVLPPGLDTSEPTEEELGRFLVERALKAYGVATLSEIVDHIRTAGKKTIEKALNGLVESGTVIPVTIEGIANGQYYSLKNAINRKISESNYIQILSPFDNLIIQRDRVKKLFNFDYTLECYVPSQKRKYGYFVHPILWNDDLVGRVDMKADRKKKIFKIVSLNFESGFKPDNQFYAVFADKIKSLVLFNNCDSIAIGSVSPAKYKNTLRRYIQDK